MVVTIFNAWRKDGVTDVVLKARMKSSRIANDRSLRVMRLPWVRVTRKKSIIKNILNFSQNPAGFLLESSSIPEVVNDGGGGGGGDPLILPTSSVESLQGTSLWNGTLAKA